MSPFLVSTISRTLPFASSIYHSGRIRIFPSVEIEFLQVLPRPTLLEIKQQLNSRTCWKLDWNRLCLSQSWMSWTSLSVQNLGIDVMLNIWKFAITYDLYNVTFNVSGLFISFKCTTSNVGIKWTLVSSNSSFAV